jgi:hypothetical protein
MKFQTSPNFDKFELVTFKTDFQTTKYVHFWNQQFATKKAPYRYICRQPQNFDIHMRIFNHPGLGAPLKKNSQKLILNLNTAF